jgi:hypothetical protein
MVNSIGLEGSDYVSDNIHQVSHLLSGIHLTGFGNEVARPGQNPPEDDNGTDIPVRIHHI